MTKSEANRRLAWVIAEQGRVAAVWMCGTFTPDSGAYWDQLQSTRNAYSWFLTLPDAKVRKFAFGQWSARLPLVRVPSRREAW